MDTETCPLSCTNFLKLAKTFYYTNNVFFSVQRDFLAQTGDPTGSGRGGHSIWAQLPAPSASARTQTSAPAGALFAPEHADGDAGAGGMLRHDAVGVVSYACVPGPNGTRLAGSQFFITLGTESAYLDAQHAPFGTVVEGAEPGGTLSRINTVFVDTHKRPLQDIVIRHVEVLGAYSALRLVVARKRRAEH